MCRKETSTWRVSRERLAKVWVDVRVSIVRRGFRWNFSREKKNLWYLVDVLGQPRLGKPNSLSIPKHRTDWPTTWSWIAVEWVDRGRRQEVCTKLCASSSRSRSHRRRWKMLVPGHVVSLYVATCGYNGAALGSDEKEIVLLIYVIIDVQTNNVSTPSIIISVMWPVFSGFRLGPVACECRTKGIWRIYVPKNHF